jgi:acetyl-CoA C-acetyltransferase
MLKEAYLIGGARTAIGSFCGAYVNTPAPALGSVVVRAALARAGIQPRDIDEVIFGNVVSAGLGQNVARQVSIGAGLGTGVSAATVNNVCGSSLKAVILAAQAIQCGDASVVVAGGTENMSRAPYLLEKGRTGYRMGNGELVDSMIRDGLWDVYNNVHMGTFGEGCAEKFSFTRQQQDDFAVESFQRAIRAAREKRFTDEIEPVQVKVGGEAITVMEDEAPKKFNEEKLRKLRPAFDEKGTITAGNASSINDGAAALLVVSGEKVKSLGLKPQAKILGYAAFSGEPAWFTLAPIGATNKLLNGLSLRVRDVDLFEINEAFAVVTMAAMKELDIPHEKVNVHGGAVALGHPIGASGARTLVTLINAMKQSGARIGVDVLCIGGGEAVAMAVELCDGQR